MDGLVMNAPEFNSITLVEEYLVKVDNLTDEEKTLVRNLSIKYQNNIDFLYQIYEAIGCGQLLLVDEKRNISCTVSGDYAKITIDEIEKEIMTEKLKTALESVAVLLEDVLPLGSMVELKKELLTSLPGIENVDKVRVVVTKRFVAHQKNEDYFYTYGGTIYPIGMNYDFAFSKNLISRVVQKGYKDDVEKAYVYQMKRQLILDQHRVLSTFKKFREEAIV